MINVSASIMCGNPLEFGKELDALKEAGANLVHFDMMDGRYVENIAMGLYMLKAMTKRCDIPFDVHMAVEEPERYFKELAECGAKYVCVHPETVRHLNRAIMTLKELGIKPGIAINPATGLDVMDYCIEDIDMVLMMTVNPGFSGQKFVDGVLRKIEALKKMAEERNPDLLIAVDGNIGEKTIPPCAKAGANTFVVGTTALFKGNRKDYKESIKKIIEYAK